MYIAGLMVKLCSSEQLFAYIAYIYDYHNTKANSLTLQRWSRLSLLWISSDHTMHVSGSTCSTYGQHHA